MIEKAKVTLEVTAKIADEFIEFQSEAIGTAFGRWGYKKSDIEKALIELEAYKGTALTPNEIVSLKERKNDGERFEFDFMNVKSFDCQCGRHYVNTGAENNDGWIPVDKYGLPKDEGVYDLTIINGLEEYVSVRWQFLSGTHLSGTQHYVDGVHYWADNYQGNPINEFLSERVIAWRKKPEPYRPERSEE